MPNHTLTQTGKPAFGLPGDTRAHWPQWRTNALMPLAKSEKNTVFDAYARHEKDTGSPEVQVALLTVRINQLTEHLKIHKHDEHSRRGLLKLVGQRLRHLRYLNQTNPAGYQALIERLGLRDFIRR
jgi:small subunit ribosomal protein S15